MICTLICSFQIVCITLYHCIIPMENTVHLCPIPSHSNSFLLTKQILITILYYVLPDSLAPNMSRLCLRPSRFVACTFHPSYLSPAPNSDPYGCSFLMRCATGHRSPVTELVHSSPPCAPCGTRWSNTARAVNNAREVIQPAPGSIKGEDAELRKKVWGHSLKECRIEDAGA